MLRKSVKILNELYNIQEKTEALSYIFGIIEEAFVNRDLELVDDILKFLEPEKCQVIISTGILRCCNRCKKHLKNFDNALYNVEKYLKNENLDSQQLLRGLLN